MAVALAAAAVWSTSILRSGLTRTAVGLFVLAGVVGTGVVRFASFRAIDRVVASVNSATVSTGRCSRPPWPSWSSARWSVRSSSPSSG